jgi:putative membrane protein
MGFGMMGGFGLFGLLFNLLIIVGVVVLIVWAVKRFSAPGGGPANPQSPRDILQARYARGEITREQYLQMIDDLK